MLVAVLAGHDLALVLAHHIARRLDIQLLPNLEGDVFALGRAVRTDPSVARHQLHVAFDARDVLGKPRPSVSVAICLVGLLPFLPLGLFIVLGVLIRVRRRVVRGRLGRGEQHKRQLQLQAMRRLARRTLAVLRQI
jgi:hypothetical protein